MGAGSRHVACDDFMRCLLVLVVYYQVSTGSSFPSTGSSIPSAGSSFPAGFPIESCHMTSQSNNFIKPVQENPSPFFLQAPVHVNPGQEIKLSLSGEIFREFLVRAYDFKGNSAGTFTRAPNYMSCDNEKDSATNANPLEKYEVEMLWKAPNYITSVTFRSVVIVDYDTAYMNIPFTINVKKQ
ncbi:unnamed protein product [Meganyctiphanes norvegica]|uniref:Reelin domain-containing protein n=1 Tax=Meganyctiphanes norvegica TaxID=48144 RepID=A0AAV2RV14_MEGNR